MAGENIRLKKVLTPIRVDEAFVDALEAGASALGVGKSEFIRNAVVQKLKRLARHNPTIAKRLEALSNEIY